MFSDLGLTLDNFVVESVSLPEELQKMLDQRISMNMLGDMGRYTQFQAAQALPIAAANPGGVAGMGVGFGAGMAMGQQMINALNSPNAAAPSAPSTPSSSPASSGPAAVRRATKSSARIADSRLAEALSSVRSAGRRSNPRYHCTLVARELLAMFPPSPSRRSNTD